MKHKLKGIALSLTSCFYASDIPREFRLIQLSKSTHIGRNETQYVRLFSPPNRCGELSRNLQTKTLGHPRSQIGIDLVPVGGDRALLNKALDALAHVSDDIGNQMLPVGLRHHVAVEIARLHEVAQVVERRYNGKTAKFKARIPPHLHEEFAPFIVGELQVA